MADGSRLRICAQIALIVGAGILALFAVKWQGFPSGIKHWLVPAFFLYAPIIASLATDKDFNAIGLSLPDWKKAALDLLAYLFLILPAFLVSWWVFARYWQGMKFNVGFPPDVAGLILWHTLGVALPEEMFFRGWLQKRLDQVMGKSWKIPGALIGPGVFIAAAAFAGGHFINAAHPFKFIVFFPGLLFGYYRERGGSILVPIIAHAAGNITFITLQSWAVH